MIIELGQLVNHLIATNATVFGVGLPAVGNLLIVGNLASYLASLHKIKNMNSSEFFYMGQNIISEPSVIPDRQESLLGRFLVALDPVICKPGRYLACRRRASQLKKELKKYERQYEPIG